MPANGRWELIRRLKVNPVLLSPRLRMLGAVFSLHLYSCSCGPGILVGIATCYGLDDPGIESRWGTRYSAPVQMGSEDHPSSCTMDTGSFPG